MLINVDYDGVLIPNGVEKEFVLQGQREGYTRISQFPNNLFDWYIQYVNELPQPPLNENLLVQLNGLKEQGHHIRLWTNRHYELKKKTIKGFGNFKSLFDSFQFYSGTKSRHQVEGVVIDNDIKNLSCGEVGIHYEWR